MQGNDRKGKEGGGKTQNTAINSIYRQQVLLETTLSCIPCLEAVLCRYLIAGVQTCSSDSCATVIGGRHSHVHV